MKAHIEDVQAPGSQDTDPARQARASSCALQTKQHFSATRLAAAQLNNPCTPLPNQAILAVALQQRPCAARRDGAVRVLGAATVAESRGRAEKSCFVTPTAREGRGRSASWTVAAGAERARRLRAAWCSSAHARRRGAGQHTRGGGCLGAGTLSHCASLRADAADSTESV